jgi:hypothetical protein
MVFPGRGGVYRLFNHAIALPRREGTGRVITPTQTLPVKGEGFKKIRLSGKHELQWLWERHPAAISCHFNLQNNAASGR